MSYAPLLPAVELFSVVVRSCRINLPGCFDKGSVFVDALDKSTLDGASPRVVKTSRAGAFV